MVLEPLDDHVELATTRVEILTEVGRAFAASFSNVTDSSAKAAVMCLVKGITYLLF
jgi:hypothetical protein